MPDPLLTNSIEPNGYNIPRRNLISSLFVLAKKQLSEVLEIIIKQKIFKVKVEESDVFSGIVQNIQKLLNIISQKLTGLRTDIPQNNAPMHQNLLKLSEVIDNSSNISNQNLNFVQDLLKDVIDELKNVEVNISEVKLNLPEVQKVSGVIDINSLPKIYDFEKIVKQLEDVKKAIGNIHFEFPKQQEIRIPAFPKQFSLQESKLILRSLEDLRKEISKLPKQFPKTVFPESVAVSNFPEISIPKEVTVSNFPPQHIPTPVTHVSLNGLRGFVKSRNITVATSATPLPDEVLSNRRSLVIYNNSSVTVFVGGSDVTTTNGMPVPASSYSPALDASPNLILYGIISTGTANVRVLEASDENAGK